MKLNTKDIRKIIKEELAKGIPDFALGNIAQQMVEDCADELVKVMIVHINTSAKDSSVRNKRYAAANKAARDLKKDREFIKSVEDKLKETLLIFLDDR